MSRGEIVRKLMVSIILLSSLAFAKDMGWVAVSRQNYRLEPGRWQAAGNYGPGAIHLNIAVRAANGVKIGLVRAADWERGRKTPMQCQAQGLVHSTFTCDYEAEDPMVLLLQDLRLPGDALAAAIVAGVHGADGVKAAAAEAISSNVITLSHLEWGCVRNCYPLFKWVDVSKEKFDLFPIAKTYGPIVPEYDGTQLRVKMKSKVPMLLAVLPVAMADRVRANPAEAESLLSGAPCKQRAVQKADFVCKVNREHGTQQVVLMPEPGITISGKKKAEVHVTMVRCYANCRVD
jgi:hypothetical protein